MRTSHLNTVTVVLLLLTNAKDATKAKFNFTALLNGLAGLQVTRCFHHLSSFALCQGNFAQAIKSAFREARHPCLNELVQRGAKCASISVPETCVTDDFIMMLFSSISTVIFMAKIYL